MATVAAMSESTYLDAVRTAHHTVAADYAGSLRTALTSKPFDRAMLIAFAELGTAGSSGTVADLASPQESKRPTLRWG